MLRGLTPEPFKADASDIWWWLGWRRQQVFLPVVVVELKPCDKALSAVRIVIWRNDKEEKCTKQQQNTDRQHEPIKCIVVSAADVERLKSDGVIVWCDWSV